MMGCGNSHAVHPRHAYGHSFIPNDDLPGQGQQAVDDFARLRLGKEAIDALYRCVTEREQRASMSTCLENAQLGS